MAFSGGEPRRRHPFHAAAARSSDLLQTSVSPSERHSCVPAEIRRELSGIDQLERGFPLLQGSKSSTPGVHPAVLSRPPRREADVEASGVMPAPRASLASEHQDGARMYRSRDTAHPPEQGP